MGIRIRFRAVIGMWFVAGMVGCAAESDGACQNGAVHCEGFELVRCNGEQWQRTSCTSECSLNGYALYGCFDYDQNGMDECVCQPPAQGTGGGGTGGASGSGGSTSGPWCQADTFGGCNCIVSEPNGVGCGPPLYGDVYCCADPAWPQDGSCGCDAIEQGTCYQSSLICTCSASLDPDPGDQPVGTCTGTYCCKYNTMSLCICGDYSPCDGDTTPVPSCTPELSSEVPSCHNGFLEAYSCAAGTYGGSGGGGSGGGGSGGDGGSGGGCDSSTCSGCDTICDSGYCVTCCYSCAGDHCEQTCS